MLRIGKGAGHNSPAATWEEMDMKYELVIIWDTGEKEVIEYESEELAMQAERGYRRAFGRQIEWAGIRRKVS